MSEDKREEGGGAPAWMATFADLSTLLLTFFILLLSFAEMDIEKFKDALGSIQASLGTSAGGGVGVLDASPTASVIDSLTPPSTTAGSSTSSAGGSGDTDLEEIAEEIRAMVAQKNLESDVDVETSGRGVIVRVKGQLFFSPGTADMKRQAEPLLDEIADIINKSPYSMAIEGHTDNIPIRSPRFRSNWELSTARAYSALEYLTKSGVPVNRIHIAGFADTKPVADNTTREGRRKNRRVEFVFYKPETDDVP